MRALAFLALRCAAPPRRVLLRALTGDGENVHAAWTKADDWKLWQHRDDADVAELLGRKAGGVAARLRKLEDPASTAAKRLFGEAEAEETIDMDDYLALDDDALLRQCRIDYRRDSVAVCAEIIASIPRHRRAPDSLVALHTGPRGAEKK